ncbi:MAG: hypothetical protein JO368_01425 [Acidimicrobiales bacterium]|nr:hypothetical protein [Acidimicrobiales bacterium]
MRWIGLRPGPPRRRLIAVVGAAVALGVVLVVVLLVAGGPGRHVKVASGSGTTTTSTVPPATTVGPSGTPTGATGACAPADLAVATATDHRGYGRGATVTVTVTVTNTSAHACIRPEPGYNAKTVTILDGQGSVVWSPPENPPGVGTYIPPTAVAPGASYVYSTVAWDQRTCDSACSTNPQQANEGGQVPAGTYTAAGHVVPDTGGSLSGTSAPFTVA